MGLRTVECTGTGCENNPGKGHYPQWAATQTWDAGAEPAKLNLARLKVLLDAQKKRLTTPVVPDSDPDSDLVLQFLRTPVKFHADTMVIWPNVWPSPKSYKKLADIQYIYTCKKNRDVP